MTEVTVTELPVTAEVKETNRNRVEVWADDGTISKDEVTTTTAATTNPATRADGLDWR
jgi:hypothetical protein